MIGFPLTVIGGIAGKNSGDGFDFPCRTNQVCAPISTLGEGACGLFACVDSLSVL